MLLLEQILVADAGVDHRGHVDVVERRQHRGVVLGFLEALGDGLAQPRHLDAFFARSPATAGAVRPAAQRCGAARASPRPGPGLRRARRFFDSAAAITSSLVSRPSLPVPWIFDGST